MASSEADVTRGGTPLFVADASGRPRGGIVVVQEAFGVNAHIREVCRRLAANGFVAAAPHLFWRQGDPTFDYDGDFDRIRPVMEQLTAEGIRADTDAALEELAERGVERRRCGIVGFCMGGTVALSIGADEELGAAVTFYGGGVRQGRFGYPPLVERASELRTPWLGLYGDRDQSIPPEDAEALREAAAGAAVPTELVRYPDAGHGFNCDERSSYHATSAADAWTRMLAWFDAHIPAVAA